LKTHLWCRRLAVSSAILAALTLMLYASVFRNLVVQWWTDPDYSHGFLVPLFAGFILWRERDRFAKVEIRPSNFGFAVMLGALGLFFGSLGAELFTSRFSLLILLMGMTLFLTGWSMLRAVSFPLGYL
jgi:exosortase